MRTAWSTKYLAVGANYLLTVNYWQYRFGAVNKLIWFIKIEVMMVAYRNNVFIRGQRKQRP